MPSAPRAVVRPLALAVVVAVAILGAVVPGGALGAAYPTLPVGDDRGLLANLSGPVLAPGASGAISFSVGDPLPVPLVGASVELDVYAFSPSPGGTSSNVTVAGAPVLSNATASGPLVVVPIGTVLPSGSVRASVGVTTGASAPAGTFVVRTALAFLMNGSSYLLESRGWFSASVWAAATQLPNGSATLNLTVLGVSGVTPETSVVLTSSQYPWVLAGVLGAGLLLVGLGAFVYFRRGAASRSGTRRAGDDQKAPTAFGKRRTRDGD
ncbi:MAG TPA: hypothetical protein VEL82_00760 [Thermoplasmata archaeon]|nr:hypothetical protein [Thermoplasmata archaeon]